MRLGKITVLKLMSSLLKNAAPDLSGLPRELKEAGRFGVRLLICSSTTLNQRWHVVAQIFTKTQENSSTWDLTRF